VINTKIGFDRLHIFVEDFRARHFPRDRYLHFSSKGAALQRSQPLTAIWIVMVVAES
jgi:hypothetical protein